MQWRMCRLSSEDDTDEENGIDQQEVNEYGGEDINEGQATNIVEDPAEVKVGSTGVHGIPLDRVRVNITHLGHKTVEVLAE